MSTVDDLTLLVNKLIAEVERLKAMHRGDPFCWRYHPHPGYIMDEPDEPKISAELRGLRDAAVWGGKPGQCKS